VKTCPVCSTGWYETYANGKTKVGYCQHCSLETKEETTEKDEIYMPVINKPKAKNRFSE